MQPNVNKSFTLSAHISNTGLKLSLPSLLLLLLLILLLLLFHVDQSHEAIGGFNCHTEH